MYFSYPEWRNPINVTPQSFLAFPSLNSKRIRNMLSFRKQITGLWRIDLSILVCLWSSSFIEFDQPTNGYSLRICGPSARTRVNPKSQAEFAINELVDRESAFIRRPNNFSFFSVSKRFCAVLIVPCSSQFSSRCVYGMET